MATLNTLSLNYFDPAMVVIEADSIKTHQHSGYGLPSLLATAEWHVLSGAAKTFGDTDSGAPG